MPLACIVKNSLTGETQHIPLENEISSWPVLVGSDANAIIRVQHDHIAPQHVELFPAGRHLGVRALSAGVWAFDRELEVGESVRTYDFRILDFNFHIEFVD